jgi:outer membrane biosynthesis protein TonB
VTLKCRENLVQRPFSRLAAMRRLARFALALALGAATAAGFASCGGEDAELLPGSTAQEITKNLDAVKQLADEGECAGAAGAAAEVGAQVESLQGVDPELERALEQGVARLGDVITTCEETTTEAIEPAEEAPTTEETEPAEPDKKAEQEQEKEEREAEKEAEKEAKEAEREEREAEREEALPPSEGGGTEDSGGISPGAPVESGEEGDED